MVKVSICIKLQHTEILKNLEFLLNDIESLIQN
jgi:hypothetical protein